LWQKDFDPATPNESWWTPNQPIVGGPFRGKNFWDTYGVSLSDQEKFLWYKISDALKQTTKLWLSGQINTLPEDLLKNKTVAAAKKVAQVECTVDYAADCTLVKYKMDEEAKKPAAVNAKRKLDEFLNTKVSAKPSPEQVKARFDLKKAEEESCQREEAAKAAAAAKGRVNLRRRV
jgi:hypothetical protein